MIDPLQPVPKVCILLPVLNEKTNIGPLLERIDEVFPTQRYTVCVVDDGSTDGTLEYVKSVASAPGSRVHLIVRKKTGRGSQRGGALRAALLWGLSSPEYTVFVEMDGDLSHRPEELPEGLRLITEGVCDVAIASKYRPGSGVTNRTFARRALSRLANFAVRYLLSPRIGDYSNGYRFYSRQAAELIARSTPRYGSPIYLSEVMAIWLAHGLRISEFPTCYIGRGEGISKLRWIDLLKAGLGVFEISYRYRTGKLAQDSSEPSAATGDVTPTPDGRPIRCSICSTVLAGETVVRLGKARLVRCANCQSWIYLPRLSQQQQAALHELDAYFEHPYFQQRRNANDGAERRCQAALSRISHGIDLEQLRGERMLDIGCDTGGFLTAAAQLAGVYPIGIDVSERAVREALVRGIEAYCADIKDAPGHLRDFVLITAIDLIEHVTDPGVFLQKVRERLRPGGLLYLETPNIASAVYKVGAVLSRATGARPRETFTRLFPPEHAQYFTPESLDALARTCGFETVHLGTRRLPIADLATSPPIRVGLGAVQQLDVGKTDAILLCALLRRA